MNLSLAFVHSKIEALDLYHLYYVVHNVPNALFEMVDRVLFQLSSLLSEDYIWSRVRMKL